MTPKFKGQVSPPIISFVSFPPFENQTLTIRIFKNNPIYEGNHKVIVHAWGRCRHRKKIREDFKVNLDMFEQLSTAHRIPYSYFSLEVWDWSGPVPLFLCMSTHTHTHTHTHTLPFSSLLMSEPVQERGIVTLSHSIPPATSTAVFCILLLTFSNNSG